MRKKRATISKEAPPTWLPDWKDASQYPDPKTTSLRQWAWEFLRRNPEYQKLWSELIEPFYDPQDGFDTDEAMKAAHKATKKDLQERRANIHIKYTSNGHVIRSGLAIMKEQFGIMGGLAPSPSHKDGRSLLLEEMFIGSRHRPKNWPSDQPYTIQAEIPEGIVVVWFDVTRPIEDQLLRAQKLLKGEATYFGKGKSASKTRNRKEHYQNYLRILDAKTVGATPTEIGRVIYKHQERTVWQYINEATRAAIRLRDSGYAHLVRTSAKE